MCKEPQRNVFLFTFGQASGKRKALEEGPWMVGKNLIVMVDFDPAKTLEEYEFTIIPIWVRVTKMPLGFMSEENGGIIGDEIGEFMEVTRGMMIMWLEVSLG